MAIFINGKSIHPFINGKRIDTIYRGGTKIYADYIAVNTVLATWGYDDNANNSDKNPILTLSKPISKLKTGLVLHYDRWYEDTENGGQTYYRKTYTDKTVSFTKEQLKIGVSISYTPTGISGGSVTYVKAVSDTKLQVGMFIGAGSYNDWYWIEPRKIVAY